MRGILGAMAGSTPTPAPDVLRVYLEAAPKRVFACSLDWPGWCRAARTEADALETLLRYATRYRPVARRAGESSPSDDARIEIVERLPGSSGTEFGVPGAFPTDDRRPVDEAEADRLARLVEAAWARFDEVAAGAPEALRKGPRGGGRDRSKVVEHVNGADDAYAREIGLTERPKDVARLRAAVLEILRTPSDGSPVAGRRWTQRYAARRIAWHALDHAWEIEDRSTPD